MIPIILIIISILFDGLLTNYLPYLVNDLSIFTPLLTVTILFLICPFYRKNHKNYYITTFIVGLIYDSFYTNLLFFNAILFLIIGLLSMYIYKNYEVSYLRLIIYIVIIISLYEILTGIILFTFRIVPVTPIKVIYKITHSLLINILYGEIVFFILNRLPKKLKKISIN